MITIFRTICAVIIILIGIDNSYANDHPKRYISLAPSTTEILFALGLDDEIVGVSTYCNRPAAAARKEKVGDFSRPNIEKILFLKPDYVFCTGLEQDPVVGRLRQLHIPIYVADPGTIQELMQTITDIGNLTGRGTQAQTLLAGIRAQIDGVRARVTMVLPGSRPKVFIEFWHEPLMTAGRGSFINEMIEAAGGINIASDTVRPYSIFSPEEVIRRDPDCIIISSMDKGIGVQQLKKRFGWDRVSAVESGRVFNDIDADMLLRPGPRVGECVKAIHARLYPDEAAQ